MCAPSGASKAMSRLLLLLLLLLLVVVVDGAYPAYPKRTHAGLALELFFAIFLLFGTHATLAIDAFCHHFQLEETRFQLKETGYHLKET